MHVVWECAAKMGTKRVLLQANHGPIVAAEDVPTAWWYLYYLERAAKLTLAAMSTGRPLRTISDKVSLWTSCTVMGLCLEQLFKE